MDFEIGTVGCEQIRPKSDRNPSKSDRNPTEIRRNPTEIHKNPSKFDGLYSETDRLNRIQKAKDICY